MTNKNWKKAAEILKKGGVIIIPSDSVYGIAALANNHTAVKKLYSIKKREDSKPSLVIVSSVKQAQELIKFTDLARILSTKFWPGGLTIVGDANIQTMSPLIYGNNHTLAVRLPKKTELIELAQSIGPFILPSANLSGLPPAVKFEKLDPKLINLVDFTLEEKTDNNPISTLVDIRGKSPIILRQGSINLDSP